MKRMSEYMHELKIKTGYESLKAQYMQKYPALGPKNTNINEQMDEEVTVENPDEIANLNEKIVHIEKEADETRKSFEQRLHQAKRNGDLAKNKISTATECLDMFLIDNLKSRELDESDPLLKFLVTQYSSLLYTPECYSVNSDNCEVLLSELLFADLIAANPEISDKVRKFKTHLKEKLSLDYSVRRERRLSTGSFRSRLPSIPTKRGHDESKGNTPKHPRPSLSS